MLYSKTLLNAPARQRLLKPCQTEVPLYGHSILLQKWVLKKSSAFKRGYFLTYGDWCTYFSCLKCAVRRLYTECFKRLELAKISYKISFLAQSVEWESLYLRRTMKKCWLEKQLKQKGWRWGSMMSLTSFQSNIPRDPFRKWWPVC